MNDHQSERPHENKDLSRQKEGRFLSRRGLQQFTGQDNLGHLHCSNQSSIPREWQEEQVESCIEDSQSFWGWVGLWEALYLSCSALKEPYPSSLQVKCLDKSAIWVYTWCYQGTMENRGIHKCPLYKPPMFKLLPCSLMIEMDIYLFILTPTLLFSQGICR